MTIPAPAPQSDHESLCADVPIGRIDTGTITYLSVFIDLYHRHSAYFGAVEGEAAHFLEVSIQVGVRPLTRGVRPKMVAKYVSGFGQFGRRDGPWPLHGFHVVRGLDLRALTRLGELSDMYNKRAVFITRQHEVELRDIAARLAGNAPPTSNDG